MGSDSREAAAIACLKSILGNSSPIRAAAVKERVTVLEFDEKPSCYRLAYGCGSVIRNSPVTTFPRRRIFITGALLQRLRAGAEQKHRSIGDQLLPPVALWFNVVAHHPCRQTVASGENLPSGL